MPTWSEVLDEIKECPRRDSIDFIRRRYLKELSSETGRNTIAYYSGWLQKPSTNGVTINDDDKNGFMAAIHGLDRSKGLDLLLHTPGGDVAATESIVHYLKQMFGNNIRAIIPQIAMSAGTMIACSCEVIIMGKQSNIGPIDPQFGGIAAHGVIAEFKKAIESIRQDPASIPMWQTIVSKYHPTFLGECENAIKLSTEIVSAWLKSNMFKDIEDPVKTDTVNIIIEKLNNHDDTLLHARHIHMEQAQDIGLIVKSLENDFEQRFQDMVLTVHHAFMHTMSNTPAIKIIENHNGNAIVYNAK